MPSVQKVFFVFSADGQWTVSDIRHACDVRQGTLNSWSWGLRASEVEELSELNDQKDISRQR